MRPTLIDLDTGEELWTSVQCAEHLGILRNTWSAYVARHEQTGAPQPVGTFDRLTVWSAQEVQRWTR